MQAVELIKAFLENEDDRIYKLGGYAGTGKTTVIKYIIKHLLADTPYAVAAFTGKAVSVLRNKEVWSAQTLHSLLYKTEYDPSTKKLIHRPVESLYGVKLVIVDEASMISRDLFADLLKHQVKCLFVGDPGQLEPVGDNPDLMEDCDFVLEKIHRQAQGSPIIRLAQAIRLGTYQWQTGTWGKLTITKSHTLLSNPEWSGIAIAGKNVTRHRINALRRQVLGRTGTLQIGEPVVCLANDKEKFVFNGMTFVVKEVSGKTYRRMGHEILYVTVEDDLGEIYPDLVMVVESFGTDIKNKLAYKKLNLFDYGYVLTAHKSQGSEWADVAVIDEPLYGSDPRRWRYTAVTRASERLAYLL